MSVKSERLTNTGRMKLVWRRNGAIRPGMPIVTVQLLRFGNSSARWMGSRKSVDVTRPSPTS